MPVIGVMPGPETNKIISRRKSLATHGGVKRPHRYVRGSGLVREARRRVRRTTPLHLAAGEGRVARARKLLKEESTNIDEKDGFGRTALYRAVEEQQTKIASLLLKNGARPNVKAYEEVTRWTPLGMRGATALHLAVKDEQAIMVELLLKWKSDVNAEDNNKSTPLHLAAANGNAQIAGLLLARVDNAGTRAETRHFRSQRTDPSAKTTDGSTALHYAAEHGRGATVGLLLDSGAAVNAKNNLKWTALHLAACNGHNDVVHRLLEHGADAEAKESTGDTPEALAEINGHQKIVDQLRQHRNRDQKPEAKPQRGITENIVRFWSLLGARPA